MRAILLAAAFVSLAMHAASAEGASPSARKGQPCPGSTIAVVGQFLGIRNFSHQSDPVSPGVVSTAACRNSLADRKVTIAAVAYDEGKEDTKSLVVALVDLRAHRVVSSYRREIDEDAAMRVDDGSLRIDTAPYTLSPGVRAFGVDLSSGYIANCGDGGFGAERTLYVQEGKLLRPILSLTMSYWRIRGGNACASEVKAMQNMVTETINLSIGVDSAATNGFRDLVIRATSTVDGGGTKAPRPSLRHRLRFDGREYDTGEFTNRLEKWKQ
jgi:hypothetical protein